MSDTVTCSVCGETVGRMGIGKHAGMHRREFREKFGRPPEDYDEVREAFRGRAGAGGTADGVATLDDYR